MEAMSSAENPSAADQSTTANVLSTAATHQTERDLKEIKEEMSERCMRVNQNVLSTATPHHAERNLKGTNEE